MVWLVLVLVFAVLVAKVVAVRRSLPGERSHERIMPGRIPGVSSGAPLHDASVFDRKEPSSGERREHARRRTPVTEESLKRAYTDGRISVEQLEAALDRLYSGGNASGGGASGSEDS